MLQAAKKRYFEPSPKSEHVTEANHKKMKLLAGAKGDYGDLTLPLHGQAPPFDTVLRLQHHLHPPSPQYTEHERQRDQQQLVRQDELALAGSGQHWPGWSGQRGSTSRTVNDLQYGQYPSPPLEAQSDRPSDYSDNASHSNRYPSWNIQTQATQAAYWNYYQQWYVQSPYQQPFSQPNAWSVQYQHPLTQPLLAGGQMQEQQQLQPQASSMQIRYPLRSLNATVPVFTPMNQPQPQQPTVSVSPEFLQRMRQGKDPNEVSQAAQDKAARRKAKKESKKEAKKLQQTLQQAGFGNGTSNTAPFQAHPQSTDMDMTPEPADNNGYRKIKQTERVHVLARPNPSASYMQRALEPPRTISNPQPLLVVLDLNGTLLFRKKHGGSNKFVARPRVREFLDYLFKNHSVMVWSSARPENVTKMCSDLFTPKQSHDLIAMWGRDKLQLPEHAYWQKVQVYKQLTWVWQDNSIQVMNPRIGIESWDQTNTVLIDDSFEKAASEPYNLIQIDEFEGKVEQMKDDVLSQVVQYLNVLRWQANVSAYARIRPFKYSPVDADDHHLAKGGVTLDRSGTSLQQP